MSHFYGVLSGLHKEVTRTGTRASGVCTQVAGWHGAIQVKVFERDGVDYFEVSLIPWQGSGGSSRQLAYGVLECK